MSRGTLDPASLPCLSRTGLSPSLAGLSRTVLLGLVVDSAVRTPECTHWFGLFPVRSPLLRKSTNVSFSSSGYLDVSVHRVPSVYLWIQYTVTEVCSAGFPPFRHLRVNGYLLLTAAFRSLSRLSSALSAKASSLRSLQLNLQNSLAILVWSVLHSVALQTWLFLNCFVFPLMLLNGLGCSWFLMIGMLLFHLPISLFEIFRSLTSSILILEIIFNVQVFIYCSRCEKSLWLMPECCFYRCDSVIQDQKLLSLDHW